MRRYREDPEFRAATILRQCVKRMFRDVAINKESKTFDLVGYTKEEFICSLEAKFTSEMNWLNHGSFWELDHIIPMAAFDLKLPHHRLYVNSLENLQPLSISDHLVKTSLDIPRIKLLKSSGVIYDEWVWLINEKS